MNKLFKPRTIFTALFYCAFIYLIVCEKPVPAPLLAIVSGLMGHWFGERSSNGNKNRTDKTS